MATDTATKQTDTKPAEAPKAATPAALDARRRSQGHGQAEAKSRAQADRSEVAHAQHGAVDRAAAPPRSRAPASPRPAPTRTETATATAPRAQAKALNGGRSSSPASSTPRRSP